ncbi:MAG: RNA polymerase sigma factor [Sciscionella sp.]
MTQRTDSELVAAAQRGDHAAFDVLVRRHTTRLFRIALRLVGDPADAEDVVQDAWISVWRALPKFRGDAAPSTWLYRVVTNAALAQLRRRKLTVPLDLLTRGQPSATTVALLATDPARGPEPRALRNEQVDMVLRAIEKLEPTQRVPLVLHELEGMAYEDVALVLGVSVAALRSRLHRARVSLVSALRSADE